MASKPRVRKGFTLVEMLVVITIIAMLAAILLPAVQAARETARRTQCNNNLKQLHAATVQWEDLFKRLPGYEDFVARPYYNRNDGAIPNRGRKVPWTVVLLPHIEQQPLFDDWNNIGAPNSTPPYADPPTPFVPGVTTPHRLAPQIAGFLCPSDISLDGEIPGLSYVANAGASLDWLEAVYNAASQPVTTLNSADGLFFDHFNDTHVTYDDRRVSLRSDKVRDGTTYTLLFSETLHESKLLPTQLPGNPLGFYGIWNAVASTDNNNLRARRWTTFVYQPDPDASPGINNLSGQIGAARINQSARPNQAGLYAVVTNVNDVAARPASNHTGGVNVAFLGGATRFLRESIDYRVYQQLMTSDDRKSQLAKPPIIAPGWTTNIAPLSTADFE
jgi:prepilin-type N-terminal cleavage/methylation domain-containing protein